MGYREDTALCCRMSDPKWPNFDRFVRTIFDRFRPHRDPTYLFWVTSVRVVDHTSLATNVKFFPGSHRRSGLIFGYHFCTHSVLGSCWRLGFVFLMPEGLLGWVNEVQERTSLDETLAPTAHFRTHFGSDLRPNFSLSVHIRIQHRRDFGTISVSIRIGHTSG